MTPKCHPALACLLLLAPALPLRAGGLSAVPSAELVRRLDSDSFTERGLAHAELKRRGTKAIDALRQGSAGLGLEARRRVLDLLRQIEDAELRDAVAKSALLRVRTIPGAGQPPGPALEIRPAPECHLWSVDAVRIGAASLAAYTETAQVLLVDDKGKSVAPDCAWIARLHLPAQQPGPLTGTIDYRVLVHHPSVAIAEPFAAVKPAVGLRGVRMTIVKAERDGGTARFTVRIAETSDLLAAGPAHHVQRERPGVIATRSAMTALLDGLELRDAKGRPLPRASLERLDDAGSGVLCRVTFTGAPDSGKGLQLVLRVWMIVRVEVGFAVREP